MRRHDCVEPHTAAFDLEASGPRELPRDDIARGDDCAGTQVVTLNLAIFLDGSHRTRKMGVAEPC